MVKESSSNIGILAFLGGLVLAIILAVVSANNTPIWAVIVLATLGIIVGLLNVSAAEVQKFLVAAIAFLLSFSSLSALFTRFAGGWLAVGTFFGLLVVFMAPAAAIVAIKALYLLARD